MRLLLYAEKLRRLSPPKSHSKRLILPQSKLLGLGVLLAPFPLSRVEALIGELLGPAKETQGQRTDLSLASDMFSVPKDDRHRFRELAEAKEDGTLELASATDRRSYVYQPVYQREYQIVSNSPALGSYSESVTANLNLNFRPVE